MKIIQIFIAPLNYRLYKSLSYRINCFREQCQLAEMNLLSRVLEIDRWVFFILTLTHLFAEDLHDRSYFERNLPRA